MFILFFFGSGTTFGTMGSPLFWFVFLLFSLPISETCLIAHDLLFAALAMQPVYFVHHSTSLLLALYICLFAYDFLNLVCKVAYGELFRVL